MAQTSHQEHVASMLRAAPLHVSHALGHLLLVVAEVEQIGGVILVEPHHRGPKS